FGVVGYLVTPRTHHAVGDSQPTEDPFAGLGDAHHPGAWRPLNEPFVELLKQLGRISGLGPVEALAARFEVEVGIRRPSEQLLEVRWAVDVEVMTPVFDPALVAVDRPSPTHQSSVDLTVVALAGEPVHSAALGEENDADVLGLAPAQVRHVLRDKPLQLHRP